MKVWQLVVSGVLVHVILFYSIFDIYFTSPLVHGMTPLTIPGLPPASRLILFVADGLRADKFFEPDEKGKARAPFLRNIIEEVGAWGVSHTRVPTESRPGHVALIAGFYEDVSAVAKGWKENPVDFDSVFNQSRYTWSWGSPDILPMFAKGASGDHVNTHCYPADLEDFAGGNMTKLDTWVFDQVKDFFAAASVNSTLETALRQDKIVLFLHLLGIDTHGHSNKPHSMEYLNNIKVVDKGIQETVRLINNFFNNDGKTAFVLTADHGMTDWGSHGAGHPQETLTPFVAWGPGVRGPVVTEHCGVDSDAFCSDWGLESIQRSDMEQAAIAPLMAYLIGSPFPVNSVGVLPIDVLSASDGEKAEALLTNAEQMLAQFEVKMAQIKERTISATFRPFMELSEDKKLKSLQHIRNLIDKGRSQDAINEAQILLEQALRGLRYYQTYDRLFLGASIALSFIGWMTYIVYLVLAEHTTFGRVAVGQCGTSDEGSAQSSSMFGLALLTLVCAVIILLLYVQSLPPTYYVYCLMPALLWYKSLQGWSTLFDGIRKGQNFWQSAGKLITPSLLCIAGVELTIQSFYHRELLSLGLVTLSTWPFRSTIAKHNTRSKPHGPDRHAAISGWGWSVCCVLVAVFPLMPVVGRDTWYSLVTSRFTSNFSRNVLVIQLCLVAVSVLDVAATSWSIRDKQGLPWLCQIFSWTCLVTSPILSLLTSTGLEERLLSLGLAFFSIYLLLSITYEGFFMLSLSLLLFFWMRMESERNEIRLKTDFSSIDFAEAAEEETKDQKPRETRMAEVSDLRRAFFFVFFIIVAFFGTGNIASINSFDPSSVYCFLTVFNPFVMGTLMMLKNILPFLVVTCALRAVQILTHTPLRALFLLVLLISDIMGLHFFFSVQDHGSWLEIGTSISHYVIVMAMITFLLLLTGVSYGLTCWRIPLPLSSPTGHKRKNQHL